MQQVETVTIKKNQVESVRDTYNKVESVRDTYNQVESVRDRYNIKTRQSQLQFTQVRKLHSKRQRH